jgi:two-component system OmpR family response regulator
MPPMPRLLLVDDDEEILDLLTRFFQQHDYGVETAMDGAAMFALLRQQQFDLVVLDLMLPREDGLRLCQRLRATSQIPVIMLTAMGDDTDRIVGLEMGADDYLVKPFNARELLARVKSVLRRSNPPQRMEEPTETRPVLMFAGWRLDLARRELRTPENMMIPLSGVEFDLLLAFTENPQRVLSRDQLLDLAHGRTHEAFDRSIDVQVSRLRRKLASTPETPTPIQTVRNGGYIFTAKVQRL